MTPQQNPFSWVEIYVQDMERAQKFYETVFGFTMQHAPMPEGQEGFEMTFFPGGENLTNASGALVKANGVPSGGNGTMTYFTSEDCSEESRVENAGGKILKPKFSIGEYGFCSICQDTEGNAFGIHSMR
ncbi:VOC family protein [Negadavirga shengliensis]|uniref:VOC family protein n=1 Tax=Negadavirga shengliensis TaxID=1389218 RepID=A0ABV9SWE0_9BACT